MKKPVSYLSLLLIPGLLLGGCVSHQSVASSASARPVPSVTTEAAHFVDATAQAGITFQYEVPGPRPLNILQGMNGGAAFLDYNVDGNLDILLLSQTVALYRGDGKGRFTEVTREAGLSLPRQYWMGCAVGDYDNDGFDDLYLSAYRGGVLLHNQGGKQFQDVTDRAGIARQPWGTATSFGDVDNDGKLDLFIGNYIQFGDDAVQHCQIKSVETACSPTVYKPHQGVLYRNLGDGRFQDITAQTKLNTATGKVLGALFFSPDGGETQSLVLANDEVPSDLMLNKGKQFQNIGELSGVAFTRNGNPYGGMGVDRGDINHDGKPDLVIATFALEDKLVLINQGEHLFTDMGDQWGLIGEAQKSLTFGEKLFDFDNDGDLDLMLVNGYIADNVAEYEPTRSYRQPTLLFRNEEGTRFTNISQQSGAALTKPIVGRALAIGDYDNDGRQDALVADAEGAPLLLHNETKNTGNYLSLRLVGKSRNRNAYGTRVTVEANNQKRNYWCYTDGSYLAASDARVHIGLGPATTAQVTVHWPGGKQQTLSVSNVNRTLTLVEGNT